MARLNAFDTFVQHVVVNQSTTLATAEMIQEEIVNNPRPSMRLFSLTDAESNLLINYPRNSPYRNYEEFIMKHFLKRDFAKNTARVFSIG